MQETTTNKILIALAVLCLLFVSTLIFLSYRQPKQIIPQTISQEDKQKLYNEFMSGISQELVNLYNKTGCSPNTDLKECTKLTVHSRSNTPPLTFYPDYICQSPTSIKK